MKKLALGSVVGVGFAAAAVWLAQSPAGTTARTIAELHEAGTAERASPSGDPPSVTAVASPEAPSTPPAAPSSRPPPDTSASPRDRGGAHDDDSEEQIMSRLHALGPREAALAIDLARRGNARFPDGHGAPERASRLIHALASQGRSSEARGEAEDMVNRYPDSDWVREIERFTGAHRHRNIWVNDEGGLEYH